MGKMLIFQVGVFKLFKVCHVEYTTWAERIWKAARSEGQDNARRVDIN